MNDLGNNEPMYDNSPWQPMWTPPPPPAHYAQRRRHVGAFVTLGAVVAGAATVGALYAAGVIGDTTAKSNPSGPANIVAQPHDFRDRLYLQRSIHQSMSHRAAKDGGVVGPVGCVDIGVRHWECHSSVRVYGQSSALTLDVRVSADYQRWISTGR
jgi:hypothetical protein